MKYPLFFYTFYVIQKLLNTPTFIKKSISLNWLKKQGNNILKYQNDDF